MVDVGTVVRLDVASKPTTRYGPRTQPHSCSWTMKRALPLPTTRYLACVIFISARRDSCRSVCLQQQRVELLGQVRRLWMRFAFHRFRLIASSPLPTFTPAPSLSTPARTFKPLGPLLPLKVEFLLVMLQGIAQLVCIWSGKTASCNPVY
jgi:hypothetical protein